MVRLLLPALLALSTAAAAQDSYGDTIRLKVRVGAEKRTVALFLPKKARRKKDTAIPLLIAIPDTRCKAYQEIGQWQQQAFEHRFAIFSVDTTTGSMVGWHPSDQLAMQRDMEAVTEGMALAIEQAKKRRVNIDPTAIVITGHSGGAYLAIWLGLRRPDLFMAMSIRGCPFWFKEFVQFGKLDTRKPAYDMPMFLYRGELDHARVQKQTELTAKRLQAAGYRNVVYKVIPKMIHESKPEVFLEWYYELLKSTAKGRAESLKIAKEVAILRAGIKKGKPGMYTKLQRLVEREEKAGFDGGAATLRGEVMAGARKEMERALNLEAESYFVEAAKKLKEIERAYKPLAISKEARRKRSRIVKSAGYLAEEMLEKAKQYRQRGQADKAADLLERIREKYPDTAAANQAEALLKGG